MATTISLALTKALTPSQIRDMAAAGLRRPAISESDALARVAALMHREHCIGVDPAHRPIETVRGGQWIPDGYRDTWSRYMARENR